MMDTNELRKLADENWVYDSRDMLLRAADEIEKLQRVYEAADVWLQRSKHLESCAFYPLGAGCTCGLDELDEAITDYEEET